MLLNFTQLRALQEMRKHLPVLPGWFSRGSLAPTGELGKMLRAIAVAIGDWRDSVLELRQALYIDDAVGDDLVRWGKDLRVAQMLGESEDNYRTRLKKEILRLRLTRQAIQDYFKDMTGHDTTVFQPWRYQDWRGKRDRSLPFGAIDPVHGRSGAARRTDLYWMGGVVDIHVAGNSPDLQKLADESVAVGVQAYFTIVHTEPVIADDAAPTHAGLVDISFDQVVPRLSPAFIRSVGGPRSGSRLVRQAAEIVTETVVEPLYAIHVQPNARKYVTDMWPPIRSVYNSALSPRSGAAGEPSTVYTDPVVFGEASAPLEPTVTHAHREIDVRGYVRAFTPSPRSGIDRRSGFFNFSIADIVVENEVAGATYLHDNPAAGINESIWGSPLTWEDVGDLSFAEMFAGHSRQHGADVLVEVD